MSLSKCIYPEVGMHLSFFGFEVCNSLCSCSNANLRKFINKNKNQVHYFHDYISLVEAVLQGQSNLIALAHALAPISVCFQLLRAGLFW